MPTTMINPISAQHLNRHCSAQSSITMLKQSVAMHYVATWTLPSAKCRPSVHSLRACASSRPT